MMARWRKREAATPVADIADIASDLPITYCEGWNDVLTQPFNPISEAEARRRHQSGELYAAVLGEPAAPHAMVEVRLETGYVAVHFFDDRQRNASSYIYDENDGRLFFSRLNERRWNRKGSLRATEEMAFELDGHVYVRKIDRMRSTEETYEQWATVADNWEETPTFGDYAGVLRREREIDPLDAPPGPPSG